MSAHGQRSPATIAATLGCRGAQLQIRTTSGAVLFGDVLRPLDRQGFFSFWPWGVAEPMTLSFTDIANASAADITTHAEFAEIRQRQHRELQGSTR
ncbi:hypothetical protein BH11MYX4_BH11MYX4_02320 [soil metagenome]